MEKASTELVGTGGTGCSLQGTGKEERRDAISNRQDSVREIGN